MKTQKQKRSYSEYTWYGLRLTIQKLRCLICLAKGLPQNKTAQLLGISQVTLTEHLTALRWRLRFASIQEMVNELRASEFGETIKSLEVDIYSDFESNQ